MASQRNVCRSRKKLLKGDTFPDTETGTWRKSKNECKCSQKEEEEDSETWGYRPFYKTLFPKLAIRLEAG